MAWNIDDLPLPNKPTGENPFLPEELSELPDAELEDLLAIWANWFAYGEYLCAQLEGAKKSFERDRDLCYYTVLGSIPKSVTATVAKAQAESDEKVCELDKKISNVEGKLLKVRALVAGYDKKYAAVSKAISRRQSERSKFKEY